MRILLILTVAVVSRVILSFDLDGSRAKAVVEYRVEGVQVVFDLRRDSKGWWTVVDAKVTEHGRARP